MSKVTIVTDSTAYIPADLLMQLDIRVVPLNVIWGEESYADGVEILPDDFYRRMAATKLIPTTSQPSILSMKNIFEPLLADGRDVLGIFISSKLSGTVESAVQARDIMEKDKDRIGIVDSLATTMAMGWPVLAAARAAQAGESLVECQKVAENAREHTFVMFVVETLEYLRRGGRIGGAQALLGTFLNIKPLLKLENGRIEAEEKVRTKRKALERMLDLMEERNSGRSPLRLATIHASAEAEALELLETARQRFSPVESLCVPLSPAIGAHVGPGTIAMAIMSGIQ
jgi:DegV family protein with EDD domain